jgi:WD40 repeat protein
LKFVGVRNFWVSATFTPLKVQWIRRFADSHLVQTGLSGIGLEEMTQSKKREWAELKIFDCQPNRGSDLNLATKLIDQLQVAMSSKLYRLPVWALVLLILSGCATSPQDEPDEAALENMLVHTFGASGADFSPNGRRVAVGTREMIWVADTATQDVTTRLSYLRAAKFGGDKSLQFIDDQRLVVGTEGAIMIWDLNDDLVTDQFLLPIRIYSPRAITWSEATQMLAFSTGSMTSSVNVVHIDEDGFGPVREFPGFEDVPSDLQFSRDGRYLAASGDGAGVIIREVATGQKAGELPTEGFVSDLELFGEHRLLVAGASIDFWTFLDEKEGPGPEFDNPDLQGQVTGQVAVRVAGGVAIGTLAVLAAAVEAFSGSPGGLAADLGATAFEVATLPVETSQQAWCGRSTTISPDGRWLADVYPGITSEIIRVYDLESGKVLKSLNPSGEYSCAARFSPDGKQLLITTNKVARLYDTETWSHSDLRLDSPR